MGDKDRFMAFVEPDTNGGCWLWRGNLASSGYGIFSRQGRKRLAHRISYEMFRGDHPGKLFVCHTCDVRCCVNPDHLWLGTSADNVADMVKKNRQVNWNGKRKGSGNPRARLCEADVLAIRASNEPLLEIAKSYGVCRATISYARNGTTWAHLK